MVNPLSRNAHVMLSALRELDWIGNEIVEDVAWVLRDYDIMDGQDYELEAYLAIKELEENDVIEREGKGKEGRFRVKPEVGLSPMLESREEESYLQWGCKMVGLSVAWDHELEGIVPFGWEDVELAKCVAKRNVGNMNEITRNSLTAGWYMVSESVSMLGWQLL